MGSADTKRIQEIARALLDSGAAGDATARQGEIGRPIPVEFPRGILQGWFVPLISGTKVLGYFHFRDDATLLSYSGFPKPVAAELWTDPEAIRRRGETGARPGEEAQVPYLTYDRVPARLAWAVPLREKSRPHRNVLVAGEQVFEPSTDEGSTG